MDNIRNERMRGVNGIGENSKEISGNEVEVVWACGEKRGALCVGRRAMVMKVQGRRKRGRHKRRSLERVKDDINDNGLSKEDVYDRACIEDKTNNTNNNNTNA